MTAMITRSFCRPVLPVVLIGLLWAGRAYGTSDLDRQLHDEYQGKILILRNFYSGKHLVYDANGSISDQSPSGDWTIDGVVKIADARFDGRRVKITAERQHLAWIHGTLQPVHDLNRNGDPDKHESAKRAVVLEIKFGTTAPATDALDKALGEVFLSSKDDFVSLVPDYWKPCLMSAIAAPDTRYKTCTLPADFLAIPGVSHSQTSIAEGLDTASAQVAPLVRKGGGMSPPRVVEQSEPQFSDEARVARLQGTVVLRLVVDESGAPRNVRIGSPIGCGLDAMAVDAVQRWRFAPAKKDGQPIAVEIAVETDFHLY